MIFDEISTEVRHDLGGAQNLEGVTPDLTTMGKSDANCYPISMLCGKEEYMNQLSPTEGPVAFGGTYNAHADSLAAARENETREVLDRLNIHDEEKDNRDRICDALEDLLENNEITATV